MASSSTAESGAYSGIIKHSRLSSIVQVLEKLRLFAQIPGSAPSFFLLSSQSVGLVHVLFSHFYLSFYVLPF